MNCSMSAVEFGLLGKNEFSYCKARKDHTAPSIDGAYSVQTHKVLQLAERDRFIVV